MKRFVAAGIDFYICGIMMVFLIMLWTFVTRTNMYFFMYLFVAVNFSYTFLFDYFLKGKTIGKRCMKIEVNIREENKLKYSLSHGILKLVLTVIWPISVLIYFVMGFRMPYDKYLDNISKRSVS